MRLTRPAALLSLCLALAGCRAPSIDAIISNRTPTSITLIEVDYPSASFGTQKLAPGAHYSYRFKVLGSGPMKVLYTDSAHHDHTFTGPTLREGAEGPLAIDITATGVNWAPAATVTQN